MATKLEPLVPFGCSTQTESSAVPASKSVCPVQVLPVDQVCDRSRGHGRNRCGEVAAVDGDSRFAPPSGPGDVVAGAAVAERRAVVPEERRRQRVVAVTRPLPLVPDETVRPWSMKRRKQQHGPVSTQQTKNRRDRRRPSTTLLHYTLAVRVWAIRRFLGIFLLPYHGSA